MPTLAVTKGKTTLMGKVSKLYSISGIVYDADGSTAVSGATITLGAKSTTSAANGTYTITGLAPGASGSMTCTLTGYRWAAITVAAMTGNLATQNYTNVWWAAGGCAASCVAAYRAIGAANLAGSYVNLANPGTNNCSVVSAAPTFAAATGWTFSGANTLDTGLTPASGWSALIRISGTTLESENGFFGEFTTNASLLIVPNRATVGKRFYNGGSIDNAGGATSGVLGVAGNKAYVNGSAVAGTIGAFSASANYTMYIGGANLAVVQRRPGDIQAVAIYNSTITSQMAAVSAAMAALTG